MPRIPFLVATGTGVGVISECGILIGQTDCFKRLRDWSDTIPGVECGHGAVGSLEDHVNRVAGKEDFEESIIELPLFARNRKL